MSRTILIIAANPKDMPRNRLDQEKREIENGLQRARKRDDFVLKPISAARQSDVRRAMLELDSSEPCFVHFCGHGAGEEGIVIEDETGNTKLVKGESLAGFFKLFADKVECVLLNACYSEIQAELIAQYIKYVIGMKKNIRDTDAIEFAVAFYDALGAGKSIEFAYKLAYNAVQWGNSQKDPTPILKTKSDVQLKIKDNFLEFLNSSELLSMAHPQKERVFLENIFVYPELSKFSDLREYETKISFDELITNFSNNYSKILIAGESQSGKTTLCKKLFIELFKKGFIPIYIMDKNYSYDGIIQKRIEKAYKEQYENISIEEIDIQKVIPIIDDFHFAKKKENHIKELSIYNHQVIVVDDIFSLNFKDENLIRSYTHFKLEELNPLLRNQLIEKWTFLTEKGDFDNDENTTYKRIDEKTELVNTTLGKIFGKGIMPAYPFFVLSIISTYDAFAKPLDQEITSQGYCYQAFIYMYLRKQGVRNDDVDTYINFLTEFAFYFHSSKKNEISSSEFDLFMNSYLEKYNLPISKDNLLNKLEKSMIISKDSCGNYCFCYQYLYYFFVAKYLVDHINENKIIIEDMIANLHKNENAYIIIFISHHSKNNDILDEVILNACCLFDRYKPASLRRDELEFFDSQVENIVSAVLPSSNTTPESERDKRLSHQNNIESQNLDDNKDTFEDEDNTVAIELRRSIKTVEVMGHIIKNRAGSLNKSRLQEIFEEAMNVHLRLLTSFFELIKQENEQLELVTFIKSRIKVIVETDAEERKNEGKAERKLSEEKLEELSKRIFWNLNFFIVYGIINKTINSIGSNKLIQIVEKVCCDINTPASFLIKHGIFMWYNKNLQIDAIKKEMNGKEFSNIASRVMEFMIVNHCSMHKVSFKERQKIEQKFNIPSKKLLAYSTHN